MIFYIYYYQYCYCLLLSLFSVLVLMITSLELLSLSTIIVNPTARLSLVFLDCNSAVCTLYFLFQHRLLHG